METAADMMTKSMKGGEGKWVEQKLGVLKRRSLICSVGSTNNRLLYDI